MNSLAVKHIFVKFNSHINEEYPLCNRGIEPIEHLFLNCELVHVLWFAWFDGINLRNFQNVDIKRFLQLYVDHPKSFINNNDLKEDLIFALSLT